MSLTFSCTHEYCRVFSVISFCVYISGNNSKLLSSESLITMGNLTVQHCTNEIVVVVVVIAVAIEFSMFSVIDFNENYGQISFI